MNVNKNKSTVNQFLYFCSVITHCLGWLLGWIVLFLFPFSFDNGRESHVNFISVSIPRWRSYFYHHDKIPILEILFGGHTASFITDLMLLKNKTFEISLMVHCFLTRGMPISVIALSVWYSNVELC